LSAEVFVQFFFSLNDRAKVTISLLNAGNHWPTFIRFTGFCSNLSALFAACVVVTRKVKMQHS
jgi:hypothetical protein